MILEVNNTFDERQMYLLRPSKLITPALTSSFIQSFPKKLHVSPFNDRTGSYRVLARDPFKTPPTARRSNDMLFVGIRLLSEPTTTDNERREKFLATVRSVAPPIDMRRLSTMPGLALLFATFWGPVGLVTFPRILWQAAKLLSKALRVYCRPEVLSGGISRRATPLEMHVFSTLATSVCQLS
jgi:DUF1365 family protein